MEKIRTTIRHETAPVKTPTWIPISRATPNGALPLAMAAMILDISEEEMRAIARTHELWYIPNLDAFNVKLGIRGRFIDTLRFDKYCDGQKRKAANADAFKDRMTRDMGD